LEDIVLIRPYERGDEGGIRRLFRTCFARELSKEKWEWQYEKTSEGKPVIVIGESDQGIIGHVALQPRRFLVKGKPSLGGLYADMMVHNEFRGKGLNRRLSARLLSKLYEYARDTGYDFTYGAPNANSRGLARRKKTGGQRVTEIPRLGKLLNPAYAIKRIDSKLLRNACRRIVSLGTRSTWPLMVQPFANNDLRFDDLWERVYPEYEILGVRDTSYMRWRFGEYPVQFEDRNSNTTFGWVEGDVLHGYITVSFIHEGPYRIGYIVDILAQRENKTILNDLMSAAILFCRQNRIDLIRAWMTDTWPAYSVFLSRGFLARTSDLCWRVRPLSDSKTPVALMDPGSWYFTLGDSDSP